MEHHSPQGVSALKMMAVYWRMRQIKVADVAMLNHD
jgi:hypothetical protein